MSEFSFPSTGDVEKDKQIAADFQRSSALRDRGLCPNDETRMVLDSPNERHCPKCDYQDSVVGQNFLCPPIGILSQDLWIRQRCAQLAEAIERYNNYPYWEDPMYVSQTPSRLPDNPKRHEIALGMWKKELENLTRQYIWLDREKRLVKEMVDKADGHWVSLTKIERSTGVEIWEIEHHLDWPKYQRVNNGGEILFRVKKDDKDIPYEEPPVRLVLA